MDNQINTTELNQVKTQGPMTDSHTQDYIETYTENGQIICHYCSCDCKNTIWRDNKSGNSRPFCSDECILKHVDFLKDYIETYTVNGQIICNYCTCDCKNTIWRDNKAGNSRPFCSDECILKHVDFLKNNDWTHDYENICNYCTCDCKNRIWRDDEAGNSRPFCSVECILKHVDFLKNNDWTHDYDDPRFNDPGCFGGNEFCSGCGYNDFLYVCCGRHVCSRCNDRRCSKGCE